MATALAVVYITQRPTDLSCLEPSGRKPILHNSQSFNIYFNRRIPNILTNATALQIYTKSFNCTASDRQSAIEGPAILPYDDLKDMTGPLRTGPSYISTEYLCQVPQRKSTGNLIVSVMVADLVLLQALWQLYKLAVDFFCVRKKPEAQYCQGCIDNMKEDEDVEVDDKSAAKVQSKTSGTSVSEQSLLPDSPREGS